MGRMSNSRIIEILEEGGYTDAARYLRRMLKKDIKFTVTGNFHPIKYENVKALVI